MGKWEIMASSEFIMKHLEWYAAQKCTRAKSKCYIIVGKIITTTTIIIIIIIIIIIAGLHNSMNEFNNW